VTDPARYGESWYEGYAASLIPKVVGQPTAMVDPFKREINGIVDAIQSQIPFLREKLMPQRDVWGEKKPNERLFGILPIATSKESHDKVKTEAARLELAIADVPKFVLESGPLSQREQCIELTPEQRDVMKEISGKFAMEILSPIVNASDWERIPDFAKAEVYKRVIEAARKKGRYDALPPEAAERQQMREKIIDEVNRQSETPTAKKSERAR
jgi:hypothetical protein